DTDVDDGLDLTSITIVSGPTNGTIASINPDGTVTYTHNGSATITDSFTYTINDLAAATSNTVTVSLVVNLLNVPPVALADSFSINEGSTTTLNLAGNDIDLDDGLDLSSITIASGPTNGTIASINPDGTVTYTHNGLETPTDSFTYTIRDLAGATSNTVTVNLTVTPVNDSPTLRNLPLALNPGTEDAGPPVGAVGTLVSSLVDLDTIPGGHDNVTDPDSGGLTGMAVTQVDATNGAWFYSTDNGATWLALTGVNPNAARLLAADATTRIYFQPNPDYFGTVLAGITFRAWDQVNGSNGAIGDTTPPGGTSGFSTAQATAGITVNPVSDPPIITSNGGGATAGVTVVTGSTVVTDVDATDADGDPLTYSIIGGADAALFTIDPTTGVLSFITAPDFQAPGDTGADNIYDVVVQVSDGTAVDTQTLTVTVTNIPPAIFTPPPPSPTPTPDHPPRETGGETAEDQAPGNGGSLAPSSPGNFPAGGQGPATTGVRESGAGDPLGQHELPAKQQVEERTGIVDGVSDIIGFFQKPFDLTTLKSQIRSLLHRSGFLQDLDRVRDDVQEVSATEKTYLASSIAVSTGMSIGYVIWLLRSGVLLTALLSSVPAWQFVNPLLVLDSAAKKKRQKGQKDVKHDSVESLFEESTASGGTDEQTGDHAGTPPSGWFRRNKP
ncbi:MAG: tandem-95 repeat protein, partial [Nitrospira sp.]|nr:tandem-95 repeat protein [Nitrospira sp.]